MKMILSVTAPGLRRAVMNGVRIECRLRAVCAVRIELDNTRSDIHRLSIVRRGTKP